MTAEPNKQSPTWVRIGTIYGGVVAGMIGALVYHAGAQRGTRGGPAGDQAAAGPGWYLVWIDQPHRHLQLSAPPPRAGAPTAELDESALVALAEAGDAIEARLAKDGTAGPNGGR
jgi:hypothetical protein